MAAGFGNIPPFFTVIGPASATSGGILTNAAQSILGPKTWITAHQDSTAENPLALWRLDEDTTSDIRIVNGTSANATFVPRILATQSGANLALQIVASATTDTGANAVMVFDARKASGAATTVRPLFSWENFGAAMLQMLPLNSGANAALSWGTQSGANPTVTNRSAGTRLVLFSAISGTNVDYAIGVGTGGNLWLSTTAADTAHKISMYAGINEIWSARGDGLMTLTGPCQLKSYTVATLPASPAAGLIAYASDAGGNGPCIAMGNGSVWKRCDNTSTTVA